MQDKNKDKDVADDFLDYMFGSIIEKIFIAIIAIIVLIILSVFFLGKVFGYAGLLVILFLIFTPIGNNIAIFLLNLFIPNSKKKS